MKFVPLPIAALENNKIFLWKKWTLKNVAKFEVRLKVAYPPENVSILFYSYTR
jgi:hypothetical protein